MVFEPMELLEKLVSLVPPPRAHQVRYHGVLAPCAGHRAEVVPPPPAGAAAVVQPAPQGARPASLAQTAGSVEPERRASDTSAPVPAGRSQAMPDKIERAPRVGPPGRPRLPWAELMRRVFAVDVLECSACGGRMRILAAIRDPEAVRAILDCLDLPSRPPPNLPVRSGPHDELVV